MFINQKQNLLSLKMTKINRIVIHGFKSFAHKTEIPFEDKFNCILGPNGSGKSNIGDALCFVLGRLSAKSMRAEKAANLIFNGGKNKKPAPFGTVEMVFSNEQKTFPTDAKEVAISRTITKDGSSIYKINDKKKTRTEVLDFLSLAKINPEGYNIILQGDITRFVEMSSLERRKIIEEISDVSIYEEKKHKALLELQKVEEQLNSAEIILKERKTYLKELKKDRDQALQFKEIKDTIESHKATVVHLQMEDRDQIKKKYDLEINQLQTKITTAEEEINNSKNRIADYKKEISAINQEIEQKGEKEQLRVHKEIEDLKVNIAKDKTRISALKDEINKIEQRKDQFRIEIKELEQKASASAGKQQETQQFITRKQQEIKELEEKIAEFKKKNKIESSQEIEKDIDLKERIIEKKEEEAQQIRSKQQEVLREKDRQEYQLQTIDERIMKVKEVEQEHKEQITQLQKLKSDFKNSTLRLNQLLDQDSSFASQLANARKKLTESQEKETKLNARTLSLQIGIESNAAIKSILNNKKEFKGSIHGTIAELGQASKKFSTALETAAGQKMQHLVVEDDKTAAECIEYLKENKVGIASFIPLNKIKGQEISPEDKGLLKQSGVHDFAINLVSFKPQFQKAFSHVFGNTLVVEDIQTARKVGVGRIKMTSLDGNLAEVSGVMRGGFNTRKSSLGFQEKDTLEELQMVEKEINELQKIITNLGTKRDANEKEIIFLRTKKAELEGEIIKMEKSLHLNTNDLDASTSLKKEVQLQLQKSNETLAQIQKSISTTNKELAELKTQKQLLRCQVNELRNPRLLAQLTAFEESRQKAREELLHLENEAKNINLQLDQLIAPEREKIKEIVKQHEKEMLSFQEEIKSLASKAAKHEQELTEREKASKEFYSKYKELFHHREKLTSEITKTENDIENVREKNRTHEREVNLLSLKNAEVKAKLAGLQEELSRYKNATILKGKSLPELQQEVNRFEILLGQMSAVNMKALEVYEQVETEYHKLVEKKDSLEKEKTDVLTFMNEIETKKKEQFLKTFQKANENFERIFSNLFKKGRATLELENSQQPFEEGINIKVKLTGNRFMDLKSLSGGEKTLTTLSFIFAIQEYQPASFYILDEIDAALDKHNSETLSKLIRAYADRAQYIVISHNDALISESDTLFGVSMNDGVSKITTLKI